MCLEPENICMHITCSWGKCSLLYAYIIHEEKCERPKLCIHDNLFTTYNSCSTWVLIPRFFWGRSRWNHCNAPCITYSLLLLYPTTLKRCSFNFIFIILSEIFPSCFSNIGTSVIRILFYKNFDFLYIRKCLSENVSI